MRKAVKLADATKARIIAKYLMMLAPGPAVAMVYCVRAMRDEMSGYRFTAAVEWRKAAELLATIPPVADHCWKQWERIINLPRRLAEPLSLLPQRPVGVPSPLPNSIAVTEDDLQLRAA